MSFFKDIKLSLRERAYSFLGVTTGLLMLPVIYLFPLDFRPNIYFFLVISSAIGFVYEFNLAGGYNTAEVSQDDE